MSVWLLPGVGAATSHFAVILANNEGNAGHAPLWYATHDAERFAQALIELGDFRKDHVAVLQGSRLAQARQALAGVEARVVEAQSRGERTLLLVYFSGHANDTGLELGPDQLSYAELRSTLVHSASNTRIAVVDACGAGTLIQTKGGHASAAVSFPVPDDGADGFAFLASTAVGEPAQESSAIEGSFFSRHLEAALRGAGDLDGDGRVTLTEAFLYASSQTVSSTSTTSAGPQHPTYETHLSGRGDVVLSTLGLAESTLVLPTADGSSYVVSGPHQFLAEVPGGARPVQLALPAGSYEVSRKTEDEVRSARVSLDPGDRKDLPALSSRPIAWSLRKGGAGPTEVSVGLSISSGFMLHSGSAWGGRLAVARAVGPVRVRLAAGAGVQSIGDAGLDYQLVTVGAAAAVLFPVLRGPVRIEVGPQGGTDWMHQQLGSGRSLDALAGHWEAVGLLSHPVGAVQVGTELSGGMQTFPLNGAMANRFMGGVTLFAGLGF